MLQKSIFLITLLKCKFGISGVFSKLEPSLKAHSIQLLIPPPERAYFAISIRLSPTEIPK